MSVTGILRQLTYFRTPRCRVECQPCHRSLRVELIHLPLMFLPDFLRP